MNTFFTLFFISIVLFIGTIKDFNLVNNNYFKVIFFDLYLGDASLIKTPNNKTILIDGGFGDDLISKLSKHLGYFERKIDLVILSHPESDHIGGLIEIIRRFKIGKILLTNNNFASAEFNEFIKIIIDNKITYEFINEKKDLIFENNLFIDFLYPLSSGEGKELQDKNINDSSVVTKITIGKEQKSILFTGDISKKGENIILKNTANLKSDILKIPHHGSKTSSSTGFILGVLPKLGIIMAHKDNKFGHPHREILERYKKYGVVTLVSGKLGDINIEIK